MLWWLLASTGFAATCPDGSLLEVGFEHAESTAEEGDEGVEIAFSFSCEPPDGATNVLHLQLAVGGTARIDGAAEAGCTVDVVASGRRPTLAPQMQHGVWPRYLATTGKLMVDIETESDDDERFEGDETFTVTLLPPADGAYTVGDIAEHTLRIVDADCRPDNSISMPPPVAPASAAAFRDELSAVSGAAIDAGHDCVFLPAGTHAVADADTGIQARHLADGLTYIGAFEGTTLTREEPIKAATPYEEDDGKPDECPTLKPLDDAPRVVEIYYNSDEDDATFRLRHLTIDGATSEFGPEWERTTAENLWAGTNVDGTGNLTLVLDDITSENAATDGFGFGKSMTLAACDLHVGAAARAGFVVGGHGADIDVDNLVIDGPVGRAGFDVEFAGGGARDIPVCAELEDHPDGTTGACVDVYSMDVGPDGGGVDLNAGFGSQVTVRNTVSEGPRFTMTTARGNGRLHIIDSDLTVGPYVTQGGSFKAQGRLLNVSTMLVEDSTLRLSDQCADRWSNYPTMHELYRRAAERYGWDPACLTVVYNEPVCPDTRLVDLGAGGTPVQALFSPDEVEGAGLDLMGTLTVTGSTLVLEHEETPGTEFYLVSNPDPDVDVYIDDSNTCLATGGTAWSGEVADCEGTCDVVVACP